MQVYMGARGGGKKLTKAKKDFLLDIAITAEWARDFGITTNKDYPTYKAERLAYFKTNGHL